MRSFDAIKSTLFVVMLGLFVTIYPDYAMSAPWDTTLEKLSTSMTGTTGQILATLAVAAVGVLFFAGRLAFQHAALVVLGIALIFSAPTVVSFFQT